MKKAYGLRSAHFSEMSGGEVNATELVALYHQPGSNIRRGHRDRPKRHRWLLFPAAVTDKGSTRPRDKLGRTPIILGQKTGAYAATMESCAFPNLGYETLRDLGREVVRLTPEALKRSRLARVPDARSAPSSGFTTDTRRPTYEGVNTEESRYPQRRGAGRRDATTR